MNQKFNNQKNEESNEEFYKELDRKAEHKSCCTCHTFIILFGCLLVVGAGLVFYLYWQVTHGGVFKSNNVEVATISEFNNKLEDIQLKNNQFTITLTASELNAALTEGLSIDDFVLKDISLSINQTEILIYGQLIKPFNSKVLISCLPRVDNKKIKFEVKQISAGNINLPAMFNAKVSNNINILLDKKFKDFYEKYNIKEVNLGDNKLIIKGQKK